MHFSMSGRSFSICLITMMVMMMGQFQITLCQESFESMGTDFFLGFMSVGGKHEDQYDPEVIISTTLETQVHVKVTTPGLFPKFKRLVNVSRGQSATVVLGKNVRGMGTELASRAVRVTADGPVTVLGVNRELGRQDSYLASPLQALGRHYLVLTYTKRPVMMLVATKKNTQVNVTLPQNDHLNVTYDGQSYRGGDTLSLKLRRYQTFHVRQLHELADLTGCNIVSNKRLVVLSGNELSLVGSSLAKSQGKPLDHLSEMLLPVEAWGTRFCLPHTPNRGRVADVYRVLASQNNTRFVLGDGTVKTIQQAGQFEELSLPHDVFVSLQSDKPVAVAMFSKRNKKRREHPDYEGDSSMSLVVPEGLYRASYAWGTPWGPGERLLHSLTVVIEDHLLSGLRMDGHSVDWESIEAIEGCNKVRAYVNTDDGSHFIYHQDPDVRFFAMASGVVMESAGTALAYQSPLGFGQGQPVVCRIGGDPLLKTFQNIVASLSLPCAYKVTTLTLKNNLKLPWQTFYPEIEVHVVAGNSLYLTVGRVYVTDVKVKVTFKDQEDTGPSNTYYTGQNHIVNDLPWRALAEEPMQDRVVLGYESSQQRATMRITGTSLRLQYRVMKKSRKPFTITEFAIEVVNDNDLIYDESIRFPSTMCSTVNDSTPLYELIDFHHEASYTLLDKMEPNIPSGQQDALCPVISGQMANDCVGYQRDLAWHFCFHFMFHNENQNIKCLGANLVRAMSICMRRLCSKDDSVCAELKGFREACPGLGNIGRVDTCP